MRYYGITDPEFTAICERFLAETGEEAARELPPRTGALAVLAALIGCGGSEMFRRVLPRALDGDLTPEEARETVYQAADYLGLGRMLPFLDALDGVLEERGVSLPLPAMGTTDESDRLERGAAAQALPLPEGFAWARPEALAGTYPVPSAFAAYLPGAGGAQKMSKKPV